MTRVPFQHVDYPGESIYSADAFFDDTLKHVRPDDVTISFVDLSGVHWRRTGNGEPGPDCPAYARHGLSPLFAYRQGYVAADAGGSNLQAGMITAAYVADLDRIYVSCVR